MVPLEPRMEATLKRPMAQDPTRPIRQRTDKAMDTKHSSSGSDLDLQVPKNLSYDAAPNAKPPAPVVTLMTIVSTSDKLDPKYQDMYEALTLIKETPGLRAILDRCCKS